MGGQPGNNLTISATERCMKRLVLTGARLPFGALSTAPTGLLIRQTRLLSRGQRLLLHEHALPLVSPSRPAETHDDRRQAARLFARRVSAASPAGTITRWSMSAHRKHTGPAFSIIKSPPVPSHAAQVQSLTGEMTTRSGGRLRR